MACGLIALDGRSWVDIMEEFDASLRSLLELLVPIALIPGAPERLDKTDANYWNLMDEGRGGLVDQWQLVDDCY